MKKTLIASMVLSSLALTACSDDNNDSATTATLRIIETSDIHANVMDFDYYKGKPDLTIGLARTAAVVETARGEVLNSVLVDNGDLIQGSPMGDYFAAEHKGESYDTHPAHKAMNLMDYAVGNIGNHEFNYGLDFLEDAINGADFPYINANVLCESDCWEGKSKGDNLFTPYLITDKVIIDDKGNEHTIKVGYIGFVPPQILTWDKQNLDGRVTAMGIVESAEKFVPMMKAEGADIIIAIPHSGIGSSENPSDAAAENATYGLTLVDGIDAIMFGHSHSVFPSATFAGQTESHNLDLENGTINGVAAVMPGRWGDNMGQVDFNLQLNDGKWEITSANAKARPIYMKNEQGEKVATNDVIENGYVVSQVRDAVAEDHAATMNYVNAPIGESDVDMYSFLTLVQDDPTVQIVSDAQIEYVKAKLTEEYQDLPVLSAAAPFKAGGRHSTLADADSYVQVPAGPLSYKNAADLYLYPNTVVALKITGAQVKDWLECSANQFNQIDPTITTTQTLINWETHRTYNFDVMDGMTYKIDVTQPNKFDGDCEVVNADANRIVDLAFTDTDGSVITGTDLDAKEFIVATNNYRAFGGKFAGTGSEFVVLELPDMNRDAVSQYITSETAANGKVDPSIDANWDFKTIATSVQLDVVFETQDSELASQFVADYQIRTMTRKGTEADEFGFAIYNIDLQN